ncbi:MAG TPA: hypothetical protein VHK01_08170 [Lacipirellulaceae bacterium]|nr:hypothetical protein [Lacipirellulaceae bacterium]
MSDIQRADPKTRRIALIAVVAAALVGLALIAAAQSQLGALQKYLADNPAEIHANLRIITWTLTAAVVGPVWLANIYLWRLGSRIVASGLFPPPGMPVINDTIVLRDTAAKRCGRGLQILAAVMCAAALGFAVAVWRLAALLRLRAV